MVFRPLARFCKPFPPPKCSFFRRTLTKRISWRRSTPVRWVICSNKRPPAVYAPRFGKSKKGTHFSARPSQSVFTNGIGRSRWIGRSMTAYLRMSHLSQLCSSDRQVMCFGLFLSLQELWWAEITGKMARLCRSEPMRAKHGPERLWMKSLPSIRSGFFLAGGALQEPHQVFLRGHSRPVPLQRLHHALVGALAGPEHQQQRGDEHTVNLNLHAGGRFGQPVAAVEDGFDPLEKKFDLPALPVNQTDQLG